MAYKNTELIKKFNVVRDYIRDFFLYGYKKRGDFEEKSKRTYEEHYRQIRSWLKEYMYTRQSASGKAQMISVDSREVIHIGLNWSSSARRHKNMISKPRK